MVSISSLSTYLTAHNIGRIGIALTSVSMVSSIAVAQVAKSRGQMTRGTHSPILRQGMLVAVACAASLGVGMLTSRRWGFDVGMRAAQIQFLVPVVSVLALKLANFSGSSCGENAGVFCLLSASLVGIVINGTLVASEMAKLKGVLGGIGGVTFWAGLSVSYYVFGPFTP